ncbi:MAG: hypothetical protein ACFFAS_18195 [Promethearchaeota archaeon]
MSASIYKVVFSGKKESELEKITLTFRNFQTNTKYIIPPSFITELKQKSEEVKNVLYLRNIEEVIKLGNNIDIQTFESYYVVLFSKKEGKKIGFLLGNVKKIGTIIIGLWPFNTEKDDYSRKKIDEILNQLTSNSKNYDTICLIA